MSEKQVMNNFAILFPPADYKNKIKIKKQFKEVVFRCVLMTSFANFFFKKGSSKQILA